MSKLDKLRISLAVACLIWFGLLTLAALAQTTQVDGQACYTYGDKESLVEARRFCFNLAKRDAVERYCTFVRSESLTRNYQLEKDVINTLAAGFLQNIKVVEKTERGREICYKITGVVDETAVRRYIEQNISTQQSQPQVVPATPQRKSSGQFYASRKSNKYHYPWCRWAKRIKPYNLIIFNSVLEAKRAGYVACKVCRPPP
jgi:hypothetical protein